MIQQRFNIVYLMGRDNERTIASHILGNHLTELTLRRDIQSVGRLVHQQHTGVGSQGKGHKHLFLLSHREGIQLQVATQLKILQTALQNGCAEQGIEGAVNLYILIERHSGQVELLRNDKDILQRFRATQFGLDTIKAYSTLLGAQQSSNQVKQCALTCTVLTQQTINIILLQFQTEIIEYQVLTTCVLKTDVVYLDHNSI